MIIYIITNTYFNNRDKDRFGVNYFLSKGYKVIVLDIQDYTNPELKALKKDRFDSHLNLDVIACNSFKNIKNNIQNIRDTSIALLFLSNNYKDIKIKKYLQKNNIKIGIIHGGFIPLISIKSKNILKKLFDRIIQFKFKYIFFTLFNIIMNKIFFKIYNIKYYDFLITANYETSLKNYSFPKPLSIIETHCLDYDIFLRDKNIKSIINTPYVVFLDQYLLDHSDFIRGNNKLLISKDNYYNELNSFFSYIEDKFQYKVIIASHPRANIKEYNNLFNNRKAISGKSSILVKYSKFVLTHYSTAINFAIIYNKPILFLSSNEIENSSINIYIKNFSKVLNQYYINVSRKDIYSKINNIDIDIDSYNSYKLKYIKKNNNNFSTFEIFNQIYLKQFNGR